MEKQQLRKWAKNERKKLNIEMLSAQFVEKIQNLQEYKQAKNIMIYYPLKDEINLLKLVEDSTKKFYLPKIDDKSLLCCPYEQESELCESCFKTLEPTTEPVNNSLIDLVIVPALAADKNNYRLGYGGGFYDRFLADVNVKTITCIPSQLILETINPEKYDIPIDIVLSV